MKTIVLDLDDVIIDLRGHIKSVVKHFCDIDLQIQHFSDYAMTESPITWEQIHALMLKYDVWDEAGLKIDEHQINYLNKLREKGHRVVISTARDCWIRPGNDHELEFEQVYARTVCQVLRHGVYVDEVIINPRNEKLKGIDNAIVLVDDNFTNLLPYVDRDVKLLLMDAPWNTFLEHPKIRRVKRLTEIGSYL